MTDTGTIIDSLADMTTDATIYRCAQYEVYIDEYGEAICNYADNNFCEIHAGHSGLFDSFCEDDDNKLQILIDALAGSDNVEKTLTDFFSDRENVAALDDYIEYAIECEVIDNKEAIEYINDTHKVALDNIKKEYEDEDYEGWKEDRDSEQKCIDEFFGGLLTVGEWGRDGGREDSYSLVHDCIADHIDNCNAPAELINDDELYEAVRSLIYR